VDIDLKLGGGHGGWIDFLELVMVKLLGRISYGTRVLLYKHQCVEALECTFVQLARYQL
jgi:hypothetical protein